VRSIVTGYGQSGVTAGGDSFSFPPYAPEAAAGSDMFPPPAPDVNTRVQLQGISYDWLGNTSSSSDDQNAFADRSLGTITNAGGGAGPNQLTSAALGPAGASATASAKYDASGNLTSLSITRPAPCTSECDTTYYYAWDELGHLSSAVRQYAKKGPLLTVLHTSVTDSFVYDSAGQRVLKAVTVGDSPTTYSADVFDSLRLEGATFPDANGDYLRTPETEATILSSAGMRLVPRIHRSDGFRFPWAQECVPSFRHEAIRREPDRGRAGFA